MNKKSLTLLIAGLLGSAPVWAQSELTLIQIGEKTVERLQSIKAMAERGEGVFERNGERWITYKGMEYRLSYKNDLQFPFLPYQNGDDTPYRNVIDFVDQSWEFMMYNGGFYLMSREFGVYQSDEQGCFIEYIPASHGSKRADGSYIWERDVIYRTETSDCGALVKPEITSLTISSLSDVGVSFDWLGQNEADKAQLTLTNLSDAKDVRRYELVSAGFFIGGLKPETPYEMVLQSCNSVDCAEPKVVRFTTQEARVGFADEIPTPNHLQGSLEGGLGITQTHTSVAPKGNELTGQGHLDAIMNREALLLFTPQQGEEINQVRAEVFLDGELVQTTLMLPPSALATSDQPENGRMKVVFSHHAWSLPLQWDWMKPGLSLRLTDNLGREGVLSQGEIQFGGAPELVIQNIDIGMLMPPRDRNTMIQNLPTLAADYFQKIPASKLVMADYTPAYFPLVTMPNGVVYTEKSVSTGGWHRGDMREAIGKALVSTGINNANVGILSSAGYTQQYNRRYNHITAHTNVGVYTKEDTGLAHVAVHGGSGGGGKVTLQSTTGNEWSHELGHNYGLGHWPHMASIHDMESGWGWDAFQQRFIGNLHWKGDVYTQQQGDDIVPPFKDAFRFLRDAQNGGEKEYVGTISRFTLEHPAQSRKAQRWMNNGFNLDSNSPSGYVQWNPSTQSYQAVETDTPKPQQVGVPVVTLLGIYDPQNENPSQIYPLVYSNYGNVFELPQPEQVEYQLEGWQPVANLTQAQLDSDIWQTLKNNGQQQKLCKFTFRAANGDSAVFVGGVNPATSRCEASSDMKWHINTNMQSGLSDYEMLSKFGRGPVTYTPNAEVGEVSLCTLNKSGNDHDGAGFVVGNYCEQISGAMHKHGKTWRYAIRGTEVLRPRYESQGQCQLNVEFAGGLTQQVALNATRHNAAESNKFHVNLSMENGVPTQVSLSCSDQMGEAQLARFTPDQTPPLDDLKGPIIIGQEYGYSQVVNMTKIFAQNDTLLSTDFATIAEFDAFVAEYYGRGVLNNGVTKAERRVGALYVYPNPETGTRDYFVMRMVDAGAFPIDQTSNQGWKYLGSADDHVNFAFNPIKLNRADGLSIETRVKSYFGVSRLLTWDERTSTTWDNASSTVFVGQIEGENHYFIQKRPGEGEAFPTRGASNQDWIWLGSDSSIQEYLAELNRNLASFERVLLEWYQQDAMGVWGSDGQRGKVNDIYQYAFRGGYHYYRLKVSKYGHFPYPTALNSTNGNWEYLGQF
ncbi:M66 family metalloprotease [Vibrio mimicus]|uniref:M66 family metalloprotease n=1 Tax=Vibrio mimicus TaxID=674 RepID=UPI00076B0F50|nr:M66 family metalloprotease [Vibrio mimicus]AMG01880.1 peptidase M66 [Vibrio mimicus]KAA3491982.1 peptidase M66 [Vibrio mimicus]